MHVPTVSRSPSVANYNAWNTVCGQKHVPHTEWHILPFKVGRYYALCPPLLHLLSLPLPTFSPLPPSSFPSFSSILPHLLPSFWSYHWSEVLIKKFHLQKQCSKLIVNSCTFKCNTGIVAGHRQSEVTVVEKFILLCIEEAGPDHWEWPVAIKGMDFEMQ